MSDKNELVPAVVEEGGGRLVKFLDKLNEKDLTALRETIQATENKLKGMRMLEKVVAATLGKGEIKEKKYKPKAKEPVDLEITLKEKRKIVVQFLASGAKNGRDIITECRVQPAQLATIMNCDYFRHDGNMYHITTAARREFL